MKNILRATTIAVATLGASAASAIPVEWYLSGFDFEDGGTASGSFVFDADTSMFSSISVTTTGGSLMSGDVYSFLGAYGTSNVIDLYTTSITGGDFSGAAFLYFWLDADMTNAGGVIAANGYTSPHAGTHGWMEGTCDLADPGCNDFEPTLAARRIAFDANPFITSTEPQFDDPGPDAAVPLPAGLGLLVSGIGALGLMRKRRRS